MNKNVAGTETRRSPVFPPADFDPNHLLSRDTFSPGMPRATVTVLSIIGSRLLLVQPREANNPLWWVPVQGKICEGDGTVVNAAMRVLSHKLGMKQQEIQTARLFPLCRFRNVVPEGRREAGLEKDHYVMGIKLPANVQMLHNREKIVDVRSAEGLHQFLTMMEPVAATRQTKHAGIMRAVQAANARHLLNWTIPASAETVH